jgi:hypothetical protein
MNSIGRLKDNFQNSKGCVVQADNLSSRGRGALDAYENWVWIKKACAIVGLNSKTFLAL